MKGVILCAGEGPRMRPLSCTQPKHLIPVANRPIIEHILKTLKDADICEIGIVVSPSAQASFQAALGDGGRYGVRLTTIVQREPKGLAHAVQCARGFVEDEPFLLYLGDNLFENGVGKLVSRFKSGGCQAVISLIEVPDPRRFGVALLEGEAIVELLEKPEDPPSNLAIVGAYAFDATIFAAIGQIKPSQRGELEITDAIQWLIDEEYRVLPHRITGWWKDVGCPEDMIEANRLLLDALEARIEGTVDTQSQIEGCVIVGSDSQVRGSRLLGPVLIGKGARIEDSIVGPHVSLGDGVVVKNSRIENSIILEGTSIDGVEGIERSLIGRRSVIEHGSGCSLLLGDHCHIDLP